MDAGAGSEGVERTGGAVEVLVSIWKVEGLKVINASTSTVNIWWAAGVKRRLERGQDDRYS